MTRILNEEQKEEVGGETDKETNKQRQTKHPLREIIAPQILRPKYQRAPQEKAI